MIYLKNSKISKDDRLEKNCKTRKEKNMKFFNSNLVAVYYNKTLDISAEKIYLGKLINVLNHYTFIK